MYISKKLNRLFAVMFALVLTCGAAWAQNLNVTGKVTDQKGEPVVGAYVLIEGTSNGTTTDVNGVYSLNVPKNGALLFTSMGYKDVKAPVNGRSKIDVILQEDATLLGEAVVVGFGTQRKENLTGAVAAIDASKVLEARPISDVGRGLQGVTPGLNVRLSSTEVGSDPTFRIRGQLGSIEGASSPLILLDNVEIPSINVINPDDIESISVLKDAASASIYGAKAAFGVILIQSKKGSKTKNDVKVTYSGNMAFQNAIMGQGIATVDALHYTNQAAIRGGNKDAVAGAFWYVDRNSYAAAVAWDAKYGKNGTNPIDPNEPMVYGRDYYMRDNYKMGVRTYDPFDYLVRKNAPTQNHNISIAGNANKTNFNVSLGYLDQSGMMKGKATDFDSFKRYNANVRVNTRINDWVAVHAGMMYTNSTKSWAYAGYGTTADPWYYVYRWGPIYPLVPVDEYGNNLRTVSFELKDCNEAKDVTSYASVNAGITISPVKNWDIDVDYTYANNNVQSFRPGHTHTGGNTWAAAIPYVDENGNTHNIDNEWNEYNSLGSSLVAMVLPTESWATGYNLIYQDSGTSKRQTWNVTSKYAFDIAENNKFNVMVGMNSVDYRYTYEWAQRMDLMDESNPQFPLATGTQTVGGSNTWSSTLGFFGRLNYSYKEKYLFEANLRYDGSSKFPTELKWRWFPSASAGWRVTEEPWMDGVKNALTSLKLRASWGMIGDQTVSSSLYIPTISSFTSTWQHNGVLDKTYGTPALVASDITWQDIVTLDFGTDFTLFNQVNVTFDWYRRDTKNMIVPAEGLSYNIGASAPKGNYGDLRTNGWELEVNWGKIFDNGFSMNVTGTIADAVTKVTNYGSALTVTGWYNGKTYGEIWGYVVDRLYTYDDFVWNADGTNVVESYTYNGGTYTINKLSDPNAPKQGKLSSGVQNAGFGPGDVKYKDLDGNGNIDAGQSLLYTIDEEGNKVPAYGDRTVIGNTTPRYEYSMRFDFGYKNFDLSIFWQGIGKRDMVGSSSLTLPGFNTSDGSMAQTFAGNFWYEDRDNDGNVVASNYDAYYPRALNGGSDATFNTLTSDRSILNMAYLRLKNLTFGYSLPRKLVNKVSIDKLRVYVACENLLTFDHLNGLPIDVEEIPGVSYYNSSNYNLGRAGLGAPAFRTASFGVQLTF